MKLQRILYQYGRPYDNLKIKISRTIIEMNEYGITLSKSDACKHNPKKKLTAHHYSFYPCKRIELDFKIVFHNKKASELPYCTDNTICTYQ